MTQHVLNLSYGKNSLACLGAIEQLGWPLDRIIHAEVWATETIPADPPLMVDFKAKADEIIKKDGVLRWSTCALWMERKNAHTRACFIASDFQAKTGIRYIKYTVGLFKKGHGAMIG